MSQTGMNFTVPSSLSGGEQGRVFYLDFLRVFATLAVILLHLTVDTLKFASVHSISWNAMNIINSATRWAAPVFFMISGTLFLNREYTLKNLYLKKIGRIVTCFIFWSALYAGWNYWQGTSLKETVATFLRGPEHFWFLFAIVGMYVFLPLLKKIVQSKTLTEYFLIITFSSSVIIGGIVPVVGLFSDGIADIVYDWMRYSNMICAVTYASYFVLGDYLHRTELSKNQTKVIYAAGIAGFVMSVGLTVLFSWHYGELKEQFYSYFSANVVMMTPAVFVFAKNLYAGGKIPLKLQVFFQKVSKYCFGVFLIHMLLLHIAYDLFGNVIRSTSAVITFPLLFIAVTLVSFIVSVVLNKLPFLKKYIV
ncbi:MAG: acyltransferase family protein [Clostridia bacterium]|nr:acyltransferase family protein [Clostridia bacterium]